MAESADAEALLLEHCPGLTEEMLAELRAPTRLSTHRSFEEGRIRLVSMCAMGSEPDSHDGAAAPAPLVEPVKFLASSGWLITYRHPAERPIGGDGGPGLANAGIGWPELRESVARRWAARSAGSAGDLGILLMHELTLT